MEERNETKKEGDIPEINRLIYEGLFKQNIVGICIIQDYIFKSVNQRLANMFGYRMNELIDKKGPLDLTTNKDRGTVQKKIDERMKGRTNYAHYFFQGLKKDGEVIECEVYGTRTVYNNKPALVSIILDITRQKKVEKGLQDSERKFKTIVENAEEGIYVLQDNKFVLVNPKFEEIFGYTYKEVTSPNFDIMDLVSPEYRSFVLERRVKKQEGKKITPRYFIKGLTKDNHEIDLEISVSEILWNNRPAVLGVLRDVTEQKEIQNQMFQLQKVECRDVLLVVLHMILTIFLPL